MKNIELQPDSRRAFWSALLIFPPLVFPFVFFHFRIKQTLKKGHEEEASLLLKKMHLLLKRVIYVALVFYLMAAMLIFGMGGSLIPAMGSFY